MELDLGRAGIKPMERTRRCGKWAQSKRGANNFKIQGSLGNCSTSLTEDSLTSTVNWHNAVSIDLLLIVYKRKIPANRMVSNPQKVSLRSLARQTWSLSAKLFSQLIQQAPAKRWRIFPSDMHALSLDKSGTKHTDIHTDGRASTRVHIYYEYTYACMNKIRHTDRITHKSVWKSSCAPLLRIVCRSSSLHLTSNTTWAQIQTCANAT